jgi:hypothetical protein
VATDCTHCLPCAQSPWHGSVVAEAASTLAASPAAEHTSATVMAWLPSMQSLGTRKPATPARQAPLELHPAVTPTSCREVASK